VSILAGLFERRATAGQGFHVSQTPPGWVESLGGYDTLVGRNITEDVALQITAVYACVRILAETLASLPLVTYRRMKPKGKERAPEHYLYPLLHSLPNPEMTSFNFREALMGHVALRGNCYAEVVLNRGGEVTELWPLRVDKMERIEREGGRLKYFYRVPDKVGGDLKRLDMSQVFHVRGLSSNGIIGYDPIRQARQALGLSLASEEFGARFFGNGAKPGMVLRHPGTLSQPAHDRLKESWENRHQGLENAHRIAILEEGLDIKEVGLAPDQAQFLQTRKFQLAEVARWYRIPPHMLADLERATFSNIEHQSLEFVIHTMRPWLVRWEQEITRTLLTEKERARYFAEFLVDGLLRGDIQSRYQAYATGRQNGWLSANDVRELENMNPIEEGDVYLVPLNMIPAQQLGAGLGSSERPPSDGERSLAPPPSQGELPVGVERVGEPRPYEARAMQSAQVRHRLEQVHRPLYQEMLARVLRREKNDVGGAATKWLRQRDLAQFKLWRDEFYRDHGRWMFDQVAPTARAYAELVTEAAQDEVGQPQGMTPEVETFIHSYIAAFVARHGADSEARLLEVIERAQAEGIDPEQAILAEMEAWPEQRAAEESFWESVRFGNALATTVYVLAGRTVKRWVSFGKSCPYCRDLNGQVVGMKEWFLPAGAEFQPEGAEKPLVTSWNTGHPPAHTGCDCMVVAG